MRRIVHERMESRFCAWLDGDSFQLAHYCLITQNFGIISRDVKNINYKFYYYATAIRFIILLIVCRNKNIDLTNVITILISYIFFFSTGFITHIEIIVVFSKIVSKIQKVFEHLYCNIIQNISTFNFIKYIIKINPNTLYVILHLVNTKIDFIECVTS